MRFTFVVAAYLLSTPHSSGFARLASGAFYEAIALAIFYEIINIDNLDFYHSIEKAFNHSQASPSDKFRSLKMRGVKVSYGTNGNRENGA
ncbi:MAG: hypothetical protein NTY64_04495 [Deltaproteobacteria bacterium]|nr:hypothetical protein [Deltaproteobacteria bacterium]